MFIKTRDPVCCMKRVGVLLLPLIRNVHLRFLFPLPPPPSPFHQALETFRRYPFKPRVLLGSASGRFWLDSFTIPSCSIYGKFERVGGEDMRFSFPFTSSLRCLLTTPRKNCFSLPSNKEERWRLSPSRINHKYQVIARQKHAWRGTFESNVPRPRTKQNELGLRPLMPPRLSRLLAKRH